jgi:predicted transcriptional regulator/DNA-binding XRE family transcriptional regulator
MSNTKPARAEGPRLGAKVRALRRREGLSQVQLADKLGVSPSYLNLIENNRRPLPAAVLIKLAQLFGFDLHEFGSDEDARLVSDLMEAFSDSLFEPHALTSPDVRELATGSPAAARAVLTLYRAYADARESAASLASRLSDGEELTGMSSTRAPSEEVGELIQAHMNYFPELEDGAERLWRDARLDQDEIYRGLVHYLERAHHVQVRVARWDEQPGTLRRYDPARKQVVLSELLPTRSRSFQLAHQIGLFTQRAAFERIAADPRLSSDDARALAHVALANYFAGAVLMPYEPFLRAAREQRYDLDVIGRRFRVGFEQVCHRVTTLRRPGAEGIAFHMLRIDVAGNLSKRFSASGIRFARFSGACPRWNVFSAFMTPGMIRIQVSRFSDGAAYFCIARTIHKDAGGYHAQQPVQAIGLGCRVEHARELVYSDGVDVDNPAMATPVGVTCRLCERTDCEQRALPSLRQPLRINENVRGVSLYAGTARGEHPPRG